MTQGVVIFLGRSIWTRDTGGWCVESFNGGTAGASAALGRLADIVAGNTPRRWTLVFEPEGMSHQTVETPRVSRRVFASLARIRSEFPVVEAENLGWGMELPEPVQGGAFSTLFHAELTPALVHVRESCERAGSRLVAVWPLYTAAVACALSSSSGAKSRFLLFLAREFVAVAVCSVGKRSFKAWSGPMSERDWKAVSGLVGDVDPRTSTSMADAGLKRGGITVIAEGEPQSLCPFWDEIIASGRVGGVLNMDALAAGATRTPRRHPSNLADSFPVPRNLDGCLAAAFLIGILGAATLGACVVGTRKQIEIEAATMQKQDVSFESRLATLVRNRNEMEALRSEIPADPGFMRISRRAALVALASAVPNALTLTSLAILRDNRFEFDAVVVGKAFEPESLREALGRGGIDPDPKGGWEFNAAARRLAVHGRLREPRT